MQVCICCRRSVSKPRRASRSGLHKGQSPALRLSAVYCGLPIAGTLWLETLNPCLVLLFPWCGCIWEVVSCFQPAHNGWHIADTGKYPSNCTVLDHTSTWVGLQGSSQLGKFGLQTEKLVSCLPGSVPLLHS